MTATFKSALGRGGIVTVMNAYVIGNTQSKVESWAALTPNEIYTTDLATVISGKTYDAFIDHLKFANLNATGPDITITGGKRSNTLLKFGKSMRCEMQSALCDYKALVALGGAEFDETNGSLTITDSFKGPVTIVGDTFVVDQATGEEYPVKIIIYQFLPDSIISLTQDEATAATFDLNGDVQSVDIKNVAGSGSTMATMSAFYSFIDE